MSGKRRDVGATYRSFIDYLTARVHESDVSGRALSTRLGFSPNYLNNLIREHHVPSFDAIIKIATLFGDDPIAVLQLAKVLPAETPQRQLTAQATEARRMAPSIRARRTS